MSSLSLLWKEIFKDKYIYSGYLIQRLFKKQEDLKFLKYRKQEISGIDIIEVS